MANKKNNKRKFVAVGLGLIGIAGLSVASAAQLTIETANEVAMGVQTFAACDDAVSFDYGYNSDFEISSVTVSGIDASCAGEPINISLAYGSANTSIDVVDTIAGTSFTANVVTGVSVEETLGDVTIVIG